MDRHVICWLYIKSYDFSHISVIFDRAEVLVDFGVTKWTDCIVCFASCIFHWNIMYLEFNHSVLVSHIGGQPTLNTLLRVIMRSFVWQINVVVEERIESCGVRQSVKPAPHIISARRRITGEVSRPRHR